MNHIQRDFLEFLSSTFGHWQDNFKRMPVVYVGIGKPQHKLTTNQRFIASLGVVIIGAVIDYIIERADNDQVSDRYDEEYDDSDSCDDSDESS